jgi:hypothetical protein
MYLIHNQIVLRYNIASKKSPLLQENFPYSYVEFCSLQYTARVSSNCKIPARNVIFKTNLQRQIFEQIKEVKQFGLDRKT